MKSTIVLWNNFDIKLFINLIPILMVVPNVLKQEKHQRSIIVLNGACYNNEVDNKKNKFYKALGKVGYL